MFRQLLAATLCTLLVAPAYPSESTLPRSSSTPSHTYDAETLPETRVWGSNEKNLLHFRATLLLSEKQHWRYEKCSWKNVVGSVVTYDYDAFGNLIHSTGSTPNNYLFAGEQFDPDLNLYYNRARYLNTASDRFWTADVADPDLFEPLSLHRYLYANGDPVNRADPTGEQATLAEAAGELLTIMVVATLVTLVAQQALRNVKAEVSLRLNHYTRWVNLPLITLFGFNNPIPPYFVYFTPDFYTTPSAAKSGLALPRKPQLFINLTLYPYTDGLDGPNLVTPNFGELGGGQEYSTVRKIPFATRFPVIFPLASDINSNILRRGH